MIGRKQPAYNAAREKDQNVIGRRIAELRSARRLTQAALSRALEAYGVSVGKTAINKWELGGSVPNAYQLIAVSQALGVDNLSAAFMSEHAQALNAEGMQKLREYREDLIASGRYRRMPPEPVVRYLEMPVSRLPVSAGTGAFLEDENFETVSFPEASVPDGAAFGVRVSGDSMEPVYQDGQIVWVQPCKELKPGEVGIFIYGGDGYIKAFGEQEPEADREAYTDSAGTVHRQPVLISYNQSYAPIAVHPSLGFEIVGRVLS